MSFLTICSMAAQAQIPQQSIRWDKHSLIFDGKRVVPVMGEVHYSRIPQDEWREEVRKMKQGGVTMIAAYVFWNHVEEVEGVFNWSGQRNLRGFLEICKQEEMPVVLRLGPFCHGEVRNGGILHLRTGWRYDDFLSSSSVYLSRRCVFSGYRQVG